MPPGPDAGPLLLFEGTRANVMIGCRFAIYPMRDDFVDVILSAV
ncbi:MAG: hypothetical protein FJX78_03555 [Armatimonadetes bacterium]|nr:hypothetical protein [Armatimonadota bacterium]